MKAKFTRKPINRKATRMSTGFPLGQHKARGYWIKKVRGKVHYFGKIADDPDGQKALALWLEQKDDLLAGRTPRVSGDGLTLADACNRFMTHKTHRRDTGELAARSFEEYKKTCDRIIRVFGRGRLVADLASDDFAALRADIAKTNGLIRIGNEIQRTRSLFKFCYDEGLIDRPVRYGQSFAKPSQKSLRMARASKGPQMFTAGEIRSLLNVATVNIKGMVLLAINGALGNTDVAELPKAALHLEAGWLDYPRIKTAIPRRVPLWDETVAALREVVAQRKPAKNPDDERLLFVGKRGETYIGKHRGYRVHQEFARVLKLAGIEGRTFYDLRRTFQTVAEASKDLSAVQAVMGHSPPANDMSAVYRQKVDDDRLRAVVQCVHAWLFGNGDDRLAVAVKAARDAIQAATGPVRAAVELAWSGTITAALAGDTDAQKRLIETWG